LVGAACPDDAAAVTAADARRDLTATRRRQFCRRRKSFYRVRRQNCVPARRRERRSLELLYVLGRGS